MNSYFMKLFGRHCQDKEPDDILNGACGLIELGYPSKKENNMFGCFFFHFSLFNSCLCLTLSIVSFCLFLPSLTYSFASLTLSLSAIFTATKSLSKQNSWTNRPWDEFHGGSWQQQTEGRGVCQHLH